VASSAETCYRFYFVKKKKFLYACALLGKTNVSFAMSVCVLPFPCFGQLGSHWKDFREFVYYRLRLKSFEKIKFR